VWSSWARLASPSQCAHLFTFNQLQWRRLNRYCKRNPNRRVVSREKWGSLSSQPNKKNIGSDLCWSSDKNCWLEMRIEIESHKDRLARQGFVVNLSLKFHSNSSHNNIELSWLAGWWVADFNKEYFQQTNPILDYWLTDRNEFKFHVSRENTGKLSRRAFRCREKSKKWDGW